MQYHLPCVTTAEGAIPDAVLNGKTGLIAAKRDASSLADSLAKLIDNPTLRENFGNEGYRKYKAEFTLANFEMRMSDNFISVTSKQCKNE
jgi:glycosyltransferase involved in cell wall biosynthesis